jgi:excisionase family DNA binding protein
MDAHLQASNTYPETMNEHEAAEYLGTFVTQIYRWQEAGAFGAWEATPHGSQWRVQRAELDAWLDRQAAAYNLPPRQPDDQP